MLIFGAGGHAKVVLEVLQSKDVEVLAIIGKNESVQKLEGIPIYSECPPDFHPDSSLIVAIGDNQIRKKIVGETTHGFGRAIHTSALVSPHSTIGEGAMIMHNAVIQTGSQIGRHVIINTHASVDHDCTIGDFVHISPNTTLCGGITIGEGSFIGAGSVIIPNISVGEWSVIGAGSVVVEDIPSHCMAVGNPAKVIKKFN